MEIGYNSYSCGIPPELEYLDIAGANLSGVMPQGHLLMALLLYWWILLTFKEALVEQSVFLGDVAFILQEVDLLDHDEDGRVDVTDSHVPPYDAHPSSLGSPPLPLHLDPPPPSVCPRALGDSVPHSLNAQQLALLKLNNIAAIKNRTEKIIYSDGDGKKICDNDHSSSSNMDVRGTLGVKESNTKRVEEVPKKGALLGDGLGNTCSDPAPRCYP
ncbi:hypothetical protein SUGI_0606200 [Cryptomeria japonica]|nr:hypothetical protein SUGI_0606200 [Cryptomeria japonica]